MFTPPCACEVHGSANGTCAFLLRLVAGQASWVPTTDQEHVNGRLALSANHSYSALTLGDAMTALDALKGKGGPFTLTASFEAPHPPFIIPYPFYGLYPNGSIPDPGTRKQS